jgi:plasmid stabilization system protein ParE
VKLIVAASAATDLIRLHAFLASKNPVAARRAAGALVRAIASLERFPERGRPSHIPGLRELIVPFGRSAYLVRYSHLTDSDEIVVLRIWHAREEND